MPPQKPPSEPPGNTGTHQPAMNKYLLSQIQRTNYITSRRQPFTESPDELAVQLQRLVHHEGNRPPNRKILLQLRLLSYYPPVPDLIPDLVILLESQNAHVCRLAHYHIRQLAPITDPELHRQALDVLSRQAYHHSPARRACATKTYAKLTRAPDAVQSVQFVANVFNAIGGARVAQPLTQEQEEARKREKKDEKKTFSQRATKAFAGVTAGRPIVRGTPYELSPSESSALDNVSYQPQNDDGAGGKMGQSPRKSIFVRSRAGKMLLGHTTLAALRRINRMAAKSTRFESYFFDSGLMSVVPSTVRHTIALLEMRAAIVPGPVSRYLAARLPHKKPPPSKTLFFEDLGARVYYARLLSALAEDPDLSRYVSDESPKKREGPGAKSLKETLNDSSTYQQKASNLFKFLFTHTKHQLNRAADVVKSSTESVTEAVSDALVLRKPRLNRNDPLGLEFAEALVNLLKNPSNRILIEALRGLSRRKWTTWFESPIPETALYNTAELSDTPYGGTANGLEDEEEEKTDLDIEDDDDELGAYEDDVVGDGEEESKDAGGQADAVDSQDLEPDSGEKLSWRSRMASRRGQRRVARVDQATPMFLRDVGYGMVPALDVILRRLNAGLVEDEPIRRFSSADAIIVLARAKIYGHSEEDHNMLRRAQSSAQTARRNARMMAMVVHGQNAGGSGKVGGSFDGEQHPFEGLVRPLADMVDEELNPFVQGRVAAALLFIIASGAGRIIPEVDRLDSSRADGSLERTEKLHETPLLLRYFSRYVTSEDVGHGVGLRLVSELIDYLVYEVLDVSPDLAPSALEMAERWAYRHPTVGVCGRLGSLWEKVLSIGQGHEVGKSIFRAMDVAPGCERVAAAATIFLRRRTLDIAMISAGMTNAETVPEPLPRDVGVEMEKYFSLLWHTVLLGPSAECRKFAVESLGGAAALAGEPFRVCTYERLVELVRLRGLGVKVAAEQVLDCLDTLYFCRERFSEGRAQNKIARDGSNRSRAWLELVWKLTAEASAAAQILLGVPPPTGWQALGAGAAADVRNAQAAFGDVRDRQDATKLKEESVAMGSAAAEVPLFDATEDFIDIPNTDSAKQKNPTEDAADASNEASPEADVMQLDDLALPTDDAAAQIGDNGWSQSRSRSRSRSRLRDEPRDARRYSNADAPEDGQGGDYERRGSMRESMRRRLSRRGSSRLRDEEDGHYWDDYEEGRRRGGGGGDRGRDRDERRWNDDEDGYGGRDGGRRYTEGTGADARRRQEEADHELARRLQEQEAGGRRGSEAGLAAGDRGGGAGAAAAAAGAAGADMLQATGQKILRYGVLGKKALTEKVMKSAARSSAMDKLRGSSSRR